MVVVKEPKREIIQLSACRNSADMCCVFDRGSALHFITPDGTNLPGEFDNSADMQLLMTKVAFFVDLLTGREIAQVEIFRDKAVFEKTWPLAWVQKQT